MISRIGTRDYADIKGLISALDELEEVDLVIDARFMPHVRGQYRGSAIAVNLNAAGYQYQWWQGLGNKDYKTDRITISNPVEIDCLHELAKTKHVVLICACTQADYEARTCHTWQIVNTSL